MGWYKYIFAQEKPMALPFPLSETEEEEVSSSGFGGITGLGIIDEEMSEETARQEKERYPDLSYLGHGSYGVAVDLGDGKVGKYINEDTEVTLLEYILKKYNGHMPGLAKVYDLRQLQRNLWIAIVEKVSTLGDYEKSFINSIDSFLRGYASLIGLNAVLSKAYDGELPPGLGKGNTHRLYNAYENMVENIKSQGFHPAYIDAHGYNVGWNTKGELVLFDFSELWEGATPGLDTEIYEDWDAEAEELTENRDNVV